MEHCRLETLQFKTDEKWVVKLDSYTFNGKRQVANNWNVTLTRCKLIILKKRKEQ